MVQETSTAKVSVWAQTLKLIPTLVWVGCIALLLIYKPQNYKTMVVAFVFAMVFAAIIISLTVRKVRRKESTNG